MNLLILLTDYYKRCIKNTTFENFSAIHRIASQAVEAKSLSLKTSPHCPLTKNLKKSQIK